MPFCAPGSLVTDLTAADKSTKAISFFDQRIQHILSHKNALMGGQTWAQLSSVIHSFGASASARFFLT